MQNHRWLRLAPDAPRRISFGADYNPEQWPREVWDEDVRLMQQAGVDVVSVGIFSWAALQPAADTWEFGWLDEVIDVLHAGGIGVDLATATASPPPWLTAAHPEVLPIAADGHVLWPGGRQHWRATSPIFRRYALDLVERLAQRYGDHPAIVAWHVNNELGCHNAWDYSDDAARAFRAWLITRYGTIQRVNEAWATTFWSQRYGTFDEILPPRTSAAIPNPTQQLDFLRFSSDALKEHLIAEREVLNRLTPDIPVTTNFMLMDGKHHADYADWAQEIDFVSNDHYRMPGERSFDELTFSAALTSGVARGRPWFLMEHSTSAVNWQPVNRPKRPGELVRDSMAHVARGADAVCFFQWRQSKGGAEKYHSAMVPHVGPDSAVYRDVVRLGGLLRDLDEVAGTDRESAPVAVVFDWDSWWGSELGSHPTDRLRYRQLALDWWVALADAGIRADIVPADADFTEYRMLIAPTLYVVSEALRERLDAFVHAGGHLVSTFFSGIVDEDDAVWLGGYPGALRETLGIRVAEFRPLFDGEEVMVDGGVGSMWSEPVDIVADDVEVILSYTDGDLEGRPAVTRRVRGRGSAAYVSSRLSRDALSSLVADLAHRAGIVSELPTTLRGKVDVAARSAGARSYLFVTNRTDESLVLDGIDGDVVLGTRHLEPRGVAVLRR